MIDSAGIALPVPAETGNPLDFIQQVEAAAPAGWRGKLAKAAIQLLAGTERGSRLYADVRGRLDTVEGQSLVRKALANAVAQQAINDPELMERAKARFLGAALRQQENLEAVLVGAADEALRLPPPVNANDETGDQRQTSESGSDATDSLDPDWAASFTGLAESATTDELRSRLSRVLAGEIASPGTYSRSTVRLIAELDRHDLEAMRKVLPYIIGEDIVAAPNLEEPSVIDLAPLVGAGLAIDATYTISRSWKAATHDGEVRILTGRSHALVFYMKTAQTLSFQIVRLTRAGVAVAELLGPTDEKGVLERLAERVPKDWYIKVSIGKAVAGGAADLIQILPPTSYESSAFAGSGQLRPGAPGSTTRL